MRWKIFYPGGKCRSYSLGVALEHDWNFSRRNRGRDVGGIGWSRANISSWRTREKNTCVFSASRLRAATLLPFVSAALLSARTCARQYRSKQPPRNSSKRRLDFTRVTSWSFQLRLSPLLPPPLRRIRPSRRERDRRGKGENGFATVFSEKIVFRKIK